MDIHSADFINDKYLPQHQDECHSYATPCFELESPLVVSLRLFTNYIGADDSFKQLMITNSQFAQQFKNHYRFGFEQSNSVKNEREYCGFARGFLNKK
jgi:hypothetical protein